MNRSERESERAMRHASKCTCGVFLFHTQNYLTIDADFFGVLIQMPTHVVDLKITTICLNERISNVSTRFEK